MLRGLEGFNQDDQDARPAGVSRAASSFQNGASSSLPAEPALSGFL